MPGFRPAVTATAIDVESPYVEVVLGERCDLDATVQLRYVKANFVRGTQKPEIY